MTVIGKPDEPIRVLLFAGGGFGTALQLGVAHALLVSRGKAPDLVVGVSAGAVNAAALAEILQAGGDAKGNEKLRAQTARFREVFSMCQRAPGELFSAFTPDSFQIDTQKPLEPLELPIHSEQERTWRGEALASSSGLMNLLNRTLDVRLPIGAIVRVVRHILGLRAADELPKEIRKSIKLGELLRLLVLLAPNLPRLAPMARLLVVAAIPWRQKPPEGQSAGDLIFRSAATARVRRATLDSLFTVLLVPTWVLTTALVVIVGSAWALVRGPTAAFLRSLGKMPAALWKRLVRKDSEALGSATGRLRYVLPSRAAIGRASGTFLRLLFWLVLWACAYAAPLALWGIGGGELADLPQLWDVLRARDSWTLAAIGESLGWWELVLFGAPPLVGVLLGLVAWIRRDRLVHGLLVQNRLADSLFHHHPLRQIFADLFDPEYFATVGDAGPMDDVVARALDPERPWPEASKTTEQPEKRKIESFSTADPPIHVGIVAADLAKGESSVLPGYVPVVDALLAATAVAPVFPPKPLKIRHEESQRNGERLFIDGVNIANEPTRPALSYLRRRAESGGLSETAPAVHLYPITSLPVSEPNLANGGGKRSLLEVVERSLALQRFRDATLERRLTELYSQTIPRGHPSAVYEAGEGTEKKRYLRAWVYPIEPQAPITANQELLRAHDEEKRREIVAETVADGCRAALERMLQKRIRKAGGRRDSVPCREIVADHRGQPEDAVGIPGSDGDSGPGVFEVCRHCALHRGREDEKKAVLRVHDDDEKAPPIWPAFDRKGTATGDSLHLSEDPTKKKAADALKSFARRDPPPDPTWPRTRGGTRGAERPTISLLFGGGVFRGVYQVGVINALSEVGIQPDLVAGSSVGAITAAMAARAFDDEAGRDQRAQAIRRLAATYLAIDRLILTDRFSDFIRTFTVRGAQTRFSLFSADRTFRRYDADRTGRFDQKVRQVAAGLERLLWVSPFELLALVKAFRLDDSQSYEKLLRDYFQEVLDRSGVGREILGTEPLQLLIREHVLRGLGGDPSRTAKEARFDAFLKRSGALFLATATNLDEGRLEILGDRQLGDKGAVSLLQGLLASSAFPSVFRPRRAWEVMPDATTDHLLADGGLMDNLPLDAVAQQLLLAADAGLVAKRPATPHLLFSASLEPEVGELDPGEARSIGESWIRIWRRARRLGYNQKLDLFENAQAAMRKIYSKSADEGTRETRDFEPLDLEVVTVRPRWLCGTFAFHPMLGFRRREQARSIAHGCATTLHRLAEVETDHLDGWRVDRDDLPVRPGEDGGWKEPTRKEAKEASEKGLCWYRLDRPCPFSAQALAGSHLPDVTRDQLALIHRECGKAKTHQPAADS